MHWRCDLVPQYLAYQDEIDSAIHRVLSSGRYTLGAEVKCFEDEFASYIGVRHGVGLNSGTDALIMALWCLGVGPGSQVITTPFTAIPTYAAIRHVRAEPVFVDIDPSTLLMDLDRVKSALTDQTRAIIPVHIFGNAVNVMELRSIVGSEIAIVEDAAQAHGACVGGKKVGSMGDVSAFSFYPTKNLGGYGDGGMLLTNNKAIADSAISRRMYGMTDKDHIVESGINSRLDELQAAILRVKLNHLDKMNERRRALDSLYREHLPPQVIPQHVLSNISSVHHVYCALCSERRDELVAYLEQQEIQTNVYYPLPLYRQPEYTSTYSSHAQLPVVEDICSRVIALPFYPEMEEDLVVKTSLAISNFYS